MSSARSRLNASAAPAAIDLEAAPRLPPDPFADAPAASAPAAASVESPQEVARQREAYRRFLDEAKRELARRDERIISLAAQVTEAMEQITQLQDEIRRLNAAAAH